MKTKLILFLLSVLVICETSFAQTPVWTQMPGSPLSGSGRHDDLFFINETTGWSARGLGGIFKTTNSGATWIQKTNMPQTHFRSIGFLTETHGFAGNLGAGSYDINVKDTNNVLYETFDGGETWTNHPGIYESGMLGFCAMHVLDSQRIYGVGRVRGPAHFAKSEDGGTNWTVVNLTPTVGTNVGLGVMGGLMDVHFKDPTNGFVVGMNTNLFSSGVYGGRIAKTSDGGATWTVVADTAPMTGCYFWKMSWPSPNVGYASLQQNAASSRVIFYKTTDGGDTWVSNGIPYSTLGVSSFFVQGIGFVSTNEGWIGGASSSNPYLNNFIHTIDGGATWTTEGYNDSRSINRIRFYPKFGVASGAKLHIYKVPLAITAQPQSQTNAIGSTAMFNVTAQGVPSLAFQWRFNGTNIALANTNSYSITNFQAANAGNYDVVVGDFSGSTTSAVAVLSVNGAPVGPSISTQPQSQTISAGSNALFSVIAGGTAPLSYQWQFNGVNIFNATNTSVTISNAQPANAGNYLVIVTNSAGGATSDVVTLTVLTTNGILFHNDFDAYNAPSIVTNVGTTNGYKIVYRSSAATVDFKAIFGFDYSTVTYPKTIPAAPNSVGGTTKGLYLTVNKDATAGAAAVNLYPTNQFFSGDFALKFDMWINWSNPDTSTEHTLFGINHSGNATNRIGQSNSDGLFFAVAGEDDTTTSQALRDYSVFLGGGTGAPILMTTANTTFGPAPLLSPLFENYEPGFTNLFPSQTIPGYGTTPPGTAGLRWINAEVRQKNSLITWLLNGTIIAQYTNAYAYINGNILLGYNDHFNSIGDSNNFVVLDNIRVETVVPEPVLILSPQLSGNDFSFSFLTEWGDNYIVQRATTLTPPDWTTHTNLSGNGGLNVIHVPMTNSVTENYFRVVQP